MSDSIIGNDTVAAAGRHPDESTASTRRVLLYVVNDAWFLASHRFELVQAAVAAGHDVHVVARRDDSVERFEAIGCRFHEWRLAPRSTGPIAELRAVAGLARIVRQVRPDLMHLVTIKALLYGGMLARVFRVPSVVLAVAGLGNFFVSSSGMRDRLVRAIADAAYGIVLRHPNSRIVVQNSSDRDHFLNAGGVSPERIVMLPGSGVDLDVFTASPERRDVGMTVLLASRLLWKKGIREYVEAARRLREAGSPVRFVLAGTVDEENPESVRATDVDAWSDAGLVDWRGKSDDMAALLQECHVLCLPTYYGEGLPKVLIEACASARAIVCTDWPGCREIVDHDVNGLLVPPRDAGALATAIATLAEDPARRRRLGQAGRTVAEQRFAVETVVARTFDVYGELLATAADRRK